MRFIRTFSRSPTEWSNKSPEVSGLLAYFEINSKTLSPEPVSVFASATPVEELETAAALIQVDEGSPAKRHGIRLTQSDCDVAGVQIISEVGETGVSFVDKRHVVLKGTQDQFARLMAQIVINYWQGDDRLRTFPEQQIAGQLVVFAQLGPSIISSEAIERCRIGLRKSGFEWRNRSRGTFDMDGHLQHDKQQVVVSFTRTIAPYQKIGIRISEKLRSVMEKILSRRA
jgi:hypothetical protein